MEYILAHDVGTSGCKAALVSREGELLATAFSPYPTRYPRPLWAEQDPADWWGSVANSTRRVLEASGVLGKDILGMSFSSQMVNAIPLDSAGDPIGPCISWLDGRAWEEAQLVMRKVGGSGIFSVIVGSALTGKDLLPKYLWIKRNQPELYKQSAAIVDCASFVVARRHRVRDVFGFDSDFAAMGFVLRPSDHTGGHWPGTLAECLLPMRHWPSRLRRWDKALRPF